MDSQNDGYFTNMLLSDAEEISNQASGTGHVEVATSSKKSQRSKSFTQREDILLIAAWLNTSKDPVIGNDQQHRAF